MTYCKKLIFVSSFVYLTLQSSVAQAKAIETILEGSKALETRTELEAHKAVTRWNHAKELLGKYYSKSVVKTGEALAILDDLLNQWTTNALKGKWKSSSKAITKAILTESERYGLDPVFLMAVIENESSFNPEAIGTSGEIGLMQLTPQTAEWITKKYDIPWKGVQSLKDPVTNIQIGSAYLSYLREKFDFHSQLYLAAYNMGTTNVLRALEKQILPKEYASRVMQRYLRYYSRLKEELGRSVN